MVLLLRIIGIFVLFGAYYVLADPKAGTGVKSGGNHVKNAIHSPTANKVQGERRKFGKKSSKRKPKTKCDKKSGSCPLSSTPGTPEDPSTIGSDDPVGPSTEGPGSGSGPGSEGPPIDGVSTEGPTDTNDTSSQGPGEVGLEQLLQDNLESSKKLVEALENSIGGGNSTGEGIKK